MMKILYLIFSILFVVEASAATATANNPYADCIYAWEVGDVKREKVLVRPLGSACHDTCQTGCAIFLDKSAGLNADYFEECLNACQKGNSYTRAPRIPNTDVNDPQVYTLDAPITNDKVCAKDGVSSLNPNYNYYPSAISAKAGDNIVINLITVAGAASNQVFMCGFATRLIYPNYWSLDSSDWTLHPVQGSNTPWDMATFSTNTWNARNPFWTDTGINIKDGDFLSIQYDGAFHANCTSTTCSPDATDNNLQLRQPMGAQNWWVGGALIIPGKDLVFRKLKIPVPTDGAPPYLDSPSAYETYTHNSGVKFLGLEARTTTDYRTVTAFGKDMGNIKNGVEFFGILQGYSSTWSRLGLRHNYVNSTTFGSNNVGGKTVKVVWRGCSYKDGERLQYALVKANKQNETITYSPEEAGVEWHDVPADAAKKRTPIKVEASFADEGQIFLRIAPLEYPTSSTPGCLLSDPICTSTLSTVKDNYTPSSTSGQYALTVENRDTVGFLQEYVGNIVQMVRQYFFGIDNNGGIVQRVFNSMVNDTRFPAAISALLGLYITWTGFLFMTGMSPITQKEAIIRSVKIGIVAVLLQPNSWEFFNTRLFNIVTDGGLELIAYVISSGYQDATVNPMVYQTTPALIFKIFDEPLAYMVSHAFWFKMGALMLSGVMGFIFSLIMIGACVIFACAVGRMIMVYIVSLMVVALLLMLAPVFISFILFQYTNQLFQSWMKQLLSYIIQPMMLFAMMVLMVRILSVLLFHIMSFTACKICLFKFDWSLGEEIHVCLLPWLTTLMNMHAPPADIISTPLRSGAGILCLYIVAHASYVLVDTITGITSFMVSHGMGVALSGLASEVNPISQAGQMTNTVAMLTGTDKEASQTRQSGAANTAKQEYNKAAAAKQKDSGKP